MKKSKLLNLAYLQINLGRNGCLKSFLLGGEALEGEFFKSVYVIAFGTESSANQSIPDHSVKKIRCESVK